GRACGGEGRGRRACLRHGTGAASQPERRQSEARYAQAEGWLRWRSGRWLCSKGSASGGMSLKPARAGETRQWTVIWQECDGRPFLCNQRKDKGVADDWLCDGRDE